MDKREAKRRARAAAADILIGTLEAGWEIGDITDDGSEEQCRMIHAAVEELAREIRARLPEGYELPPPPASGRERDRAILASRYPNTYGP